MTICSKSVLIFILGFLSCAIFVSGSLYFNVEQPFNLDELFVKNSYFISPSDWITKNQIQILDDKIIIKIKDSSLSNYAPTGSMSPVLGENANGIRIKPDSPDQINIGDIISFTSENRLIVHRVIEKGLDENGIYFITKGDNNSLSDGKIRFEQIKYITIGILY